MFDRHAHIENAKILILQWYDYIALCMAIFH